MSNPIVPKGAVVLDEDNSQSSSNNSQPNSPIVPPGAIVIGDDTSNNTTSKTLPNSQTASLSNPQNMDAIIAQRPSLLKNALQNPIDFSQHPFKRTLQDAGAGFEAMEGVPASIGLDLQQGQSQNIPSHIAQVLQGNRPAQRGDIMRAVGTPDLLASTIGFASGLTPGNTPSNSLIGKTSSLSNFLPENIAANAITKAIGNASNATGLTNLINNQVTPNLSKFMGLLSQVPANQVQKAIENPSVLSKSWIANEGQNAQTLYKNVINPLIDNSNKKVDVSNISDIFDKMGLFNSSGEQTAALSSMNVAEQNRMKGYARQIFDSQGNMSFNEVNGLIAKIDSSLKSTYEKLSKNQPVDYSDSFLKSAKVLRDGLNNLRKTQYPQAGAVLDKYSNYLSSKEAYDAFNKGSLNLQKILELGGGAVAASGGHPLLGTLLAANAIPQVQAAMIKGGSIAGKAALSGSGLESILREYGNSSYQDSQN